MHIREDIEELKKEGYSRKKIMEELDLTSREYDNALNDSLPQNKEFVDYDELRCDQKYTRIENYRDFELYRGIILEAITRIHNSEEVFQTKKISSLIGLTKKNSSLMIDIQKIKDAIAHDKRNINDKIKKISKKSIDNDADKILNKALLKRLKNNAWAIGYVQHFLEEEGILIANILKKKHATYRDLGFMPYYKKSKIDFIDSLIENISLNFSLHVSQPENNNESRLRFTKKNAELVKHYLLKYVQKPLLSYGIDYSNTLFDEYNFQKVSLEIDMTIPADEQEYVIAAAIKELYKKKLSFGYSSFIGRDLIKDIEDLEFNRVRKGKLGKRYKFMSERVADAFYVYDMRKHGISYWNCAEVLSTYHSNKGVGKIKISKSTIALYDKIILSFMKKFEKKYKIQPSSFSKKNL